MNWTEAIEKTGKAVLQEFEKDKPIYIENTGSEYIAYCKDRFRGHFNILKESEVGSTQWQPCCLDRLTEDFARSLSKNDIEIAARLAGYTDNYQGNLLGGEDCKPVFTLLNTVPEKKLRYDLIPVEAEREKVRALTYGAKKHSDWGWLKSTSTYSEQYAALRRHLEAFRGGEKIDPESGLHNLALAACRIDFLLELELRGIGKDDLTKKGVE